MTIDARFTKGLQLFDEGEYFECHEVIEDLWLETPSDDPYRDLYKGVIQAAAAIYQKERHIMSGALGLYKTSVEYLTKYKPAALGLDVEAFIKNLQKHFSGHSTKLGLMIFVMLLSGASAEAAPYYAVSLHQSSKNYRIMSATSFDDQGSCVETAAARNADLDAEWKLLKSECLLESATDPQILKMFEEEALADPYLVFMDQEGYKNVMRFANVPPMFIDIMVWKWSEGLKKQGLQDVRIIMGPNRQKVANMIEQAAAQISKEGQSPIVFSKKKEPEKKSNKEAAKGAEKKTAGPTKQETIILKNGQALQGQILKQDAKGVLFRVGDGADIYFSADEILEKVAAS